MQCLYTMLLFINILELVFQGLWITERLMCSYTWCLGVVRPQHHLVAALRQQFVSAPNKQFDEEETINKIMRNLLWTVTSVLSFQ